MNKAMVCLLFLPLLALLACSDDQKKSLTSPQASSELSSIEIEDIDAERGEDQFPQFINDLIAEGKVDTVFNPEQYRVNEIPASIPDGFYPYTVTFQMTESDPVITYNYVLPYTCGRFMIYVFEFGTGGRYSACQ